MTDLFSDFLTLETAGAMLAVGLAAGFINVTAGGGSLLTLPLMIFLGLPETVANGTNRVAIVTQNVVATRTFRKGGVHQLRFSLWLVAMALPGTFLGAWLGVTVSGEAFRRVLGGLMIFLAVFIVASSRRSMEGLIGTSRRPHGLTLCGFALLGFYAGFIQAGIGFLIISLLSGVEKLSIIPTNAIKVFVILVLQAIALAVFASQGQVHWGIGFVLAIGLALGGHLGAQFTLRGNERLVRSLVAIAAVVLAIKLLLS